MSNILIQSTNKCRVPTEYQAMPGYLSSHMQASWEVNTDFSHLGPTSPSRISDSRGQLRSHTLVSELPVCTADCTSHAVLHLELPPKNCNKTHLICSSNSIFCSVLRNTLPEAICI